jgi:hypothetical protein
VDRQATPRSGDAMRMEILYFDGCPTYGAALKTLRKVLADEGLQAEVELVAVNTDKDARSLRLPGETCQPALRLRRSARCGRGGRRRAGIGAWS